MHLMKVIVLIPLYYVILLLNIPVNNLGDYFNEGSIDEIEGKLDHSHHYKPPGVQEIDPKTEFWGHCSNLQVWVENNYDTRLIHRNLSFPLLKKLTEVGDPTARRHFKEEIAKRAKEVLRTNQIAEFDTKWTIEMGNATISAFERSPYKGLQKIAPLISAPTRALRAMDVWANSIAFDAQLNALAKREGLNKIKQGLLKKEDLNKFIKKTISNPSEEMLQQARTFAKYNTFSGSKPIILQTAVSKATPS